ncbi:hypothetical protein H632_c341p1 [Helicosporidium sp. ATCC 50920]|nr:hypothetical protein H632_c341p1 [Helicosporidium sp. ATCC 50920]|eukprot:KDD76134.1 hypothetical protein H632_c341p1 [Helicosporidium sp. ATCC 50920]
MTRASIRRLARRAGVKRIGGEIYEDAETTLRAFLKTLVKDIYVVTEYARRRTATLNDVLLVLKRNGRTLYAGTERQARRRITQRLPESALRQSAVRLGVTHALPAQPPVPAPPTNSGLSSVASLATPRAASPPAARLERMAPTSPLPLRQLEQNEAASCAASPCGTPAPLTPERAQKIQLSLSAFRDRVLSSGDSSCAPTSRVHEWVAAQLASEGQEPCTARELEIVLDALDERNAIMLDVDDATAQAVVYFC